MENEKKEVTVNEIKKVNHFYLIVLIICLIVLLLGVSLGYYAAVASEEKDSTRLNTGTLVANFVDGINVQSPHLTPRNKPTSLSDITNAYKNEFSVENTGTLDQTFSIAINVTTNEFTSDNLKYIVFNRTTGTEISSGTISGTGEIELISDTYLESGKSANYTLIIWLNETGSNQNDEQSKKINATMSLLATQLQG